MEQNGRGKEEEGKLKSGKMGGEGTWEEGTDRGKWWTVGGGWTGRMGERTGGRRDEGQMAEGGRDGRTGGRGREEGDGIDKREGGGEREQATHNTQQPQSHDRSSTRNTTTHPARKRNTRGKKVHLGPMFERAQRGRLSQFSRQGVPVIGSDVFYRSSI